MIFRIWATPYVSNFIAYIVYWRTIRRQIKHIFTFKEIFFPSEPSPCKHIRSKTYCQGVWVVFGVYLFVCNFLLLFWQLLLDSCQEWHLWQFDNNLVIISAYYHRMFHIQPYRIKQVYKFEFVPWDLDLNRFL